MLFRSNVELFAINYDSPSVQENTALHKRLGIIYPGLAKDPAQSLGLRDIDGVPATFLFSPEGKLVDTLYGPQTLASLKKAIQHASARE